MAESTEVGKLCNSPPTKLQSIPLDTCPLVPNMVLEIVNIGAADAARLEEQVSEALAKLTPEDVIDYSLANPDTLTK